ncbi:hypothetical protein H4696_004778 [Amycolatopsis lexingtonensis]|uniref:Uncharacterized protein n=1 Tax=Amycolatopsis lexingtonensis TaxID=218822 RepID=A0ABR9I3C2_9PSEU|nr:hypothetical protein [Amycolatopsis lexingtonensis]MBE1497678.1 hypothetical protein [Amycolatopsis lexingtonensis]
MAWGKWVPSGRLPAKAALGLAIVLTGCALGTGLLAFVFGEGVAGWRRALQAVVAVAWLVLAACYWFRYARSRG